MRPDFARTHRIEAQTAVASRRIASSFAQPPEHVLGALAILLSRYSSETEVEIGLQPNEALSLDLYGDPTFSEVLRRIGDAVRHPHRDKDLVFHLAEQSVSCEYNSRLYRSITIEAFLEHLELLNGDIANNPERKLSDFSFLPAAETHRLLVEWNSTASEYPRATCIQDLLEQNAKHAPNAIAAQFQAPQSQEQTLTYAELNTRANQLAHTLAERGAGPGSLVGISLERSLEMLIAVMAVLKTGAAFLPLDPTFPKPRLEFMASDAAIQILITSHSLAGSLKTGAVTILIDRQTAAQPGAPLGRTLDPASIAYVLYTSGSTGKPKGVRIPHRAAINLLYGMQAHVGLQPGESMIALTTLSFDIAMLELFLPLLAGGRVVIASRTQATDPRALAALIEQTKPALMQATPVTWRLLVETGWNGSPKLKILIGGEAVSRELADALLERGAAVWNVYGPTETTIWSTICRLQRDGQPISIGRPIANTTLYVLDVNFRLVPIGVPGELYIGGDGVACGYLNRPELTAERFIANPFGNPGVLYRTGDIVRYLPDGRLEILGRNDGQVKVRGFRIELGDVESALCACPEVSAAAAAVRHSAAGESILIGYFVPRPGFTADAATLRASLASHLPDYMVPTFLVQLSELPLTPNGKVDRKALPAPGTVQPELTAASRGADALETTLLGIWESTLGIRPIRTSDNFFDLGGHSVLAARIFARMEKVLGKSLPLATLFQAPTVETLAAVIRKSEWKPMWSSLVPIRPAGTKAPFFFVHPIGGNVLNFSGFCSHFGPDQPIYGLQARGLNGEEAPHTTVEEMAADYIQSIRGVQPEGPYYIGGFSAGGVVAFEIARQLQSVAQPVGILALLDTEILTHSQEDSSTQHRLHHWFRMARLNLRFASRVSPLEFLDKKLFNLRMRRKLLAWSVRERLGLSIDPSILSAEEGFLLAFKRYVPLPYCGDATLFRTGDGTGYRDPNLGWGPIIGGHLDIQEVTGDHDTILQEPHIGMLARLLETSLAKATSNDFHQPVANPVASPVIPTAGRTAAVFGAASGGKQ